MSRVARWHIRWGPRWTLPSRLYCSDVRTLALMKEDSMKKVLQLVAWILGLIVVVVTCLIWLLISIVADKPRP
jgi:hypothetical protein